MNRYIRERVRADAALLARRWQIDDAIPHRGMRGRFRELLIDTVLAPWLPPYAECGTGMIVDVVDRARAATQDDIVIFDRTLVPPVLATPTAREGVFPIEGVLGRIEVKTKLTSAGLRKALLAAYEINCMDLQFKGPPAIPLPFSMIFAFDTNLSDSDEHGELSRLCKLALKLGENGQLSKSGNSLNDFTPCPISALCVLGRGMWTLHRTQSEWTWVRARRTEGGFEEVVAFIGQVSATVSDTHIKRQGRDRDRAAEGRIGRYIFEPGDYEILIPVAPDSTVTGPAPRSGLAEKKDKRGIEK